MQDAVREGQTSDDRTPRVVDDPAWPLLKEAVEELRVLQQADGSVRVPEVLRPYLGGRETLDPQ
ncbi:hypothetical protein ADL27_23155 [Streptomyces sp. NRRL F-6602]|nr:hypothetical protein ADL27_23155 [Streptomyces sp. NRRL F-6602]